MNPLDTIVIVVVSAAVGTAGLFAGIALLVDDAVEPAGAFAVAAAGALVWGVTNLVAPGLTTGGALAALVVWIAAVGLLYPSGWPSAAVIGYVPWLVAAGALYLLGTIGLVSFATVGVPTLHP